MDGRIEDGEDGEKRPRPQNLKKKPRAMPTWKKQANADQM
jgi:hypothetical protein